MRYYAYLTLLLCVLSAMAFMPNVKTEMPDSKRETVLNGLTTESGFSADELVRDHFISGSCDNVSDISGIGHADGIGIFNNAGDILGINEGIIISTGNVANAEGPNDSTEEGTKFGDDIGDKDLNLLATGAVFDAVGLEFDFIPVDSTVSFRYVFASEEYCEYVGSIFNDVFGFFISGPGIDGGFYDDARNVALLPNSDEFVSINTINHLLNDSIYVDNHLFGDIQQCQLDFKEPAFASEIQFDGFTRVLEAKLKLIPCETYHIRLVVGDVSDGFFDSAVFLEANSFDLGSKVKLSAVNGVSSDNIVYEGCSDSYFLFERQSLEEFNKPFTIDFSVLESSTATPDEDYTSFPWSVTIPPGENEFRIPIKVFDDSLSEGAERIVLKLDLPCTCTGDSAQLILNDTPEMLIDWPETSICAGDTLSIQPRVSGGVPPYTFDWNTTEKDTAILVAPQLGTFYNVTVADACGHEVSDSVWVEVQTLPLAQLSGYVELCEGDSSQLDINFTGMPPWTFSYAINEEEQGDIIRTWESPYQLPVSKRGNYSLVRFQDSLCTAEPKGEGKVVKAVLESEIEVVDPSCFEGSDGKLLVETTGGTAPYIYRLQSDSIWMNGLTNLSAGGYNLMVRDQKGCEKYIDISITEPTPLELGAINCKDLRRELINITGIGGQPPYQYSVDGGSFQDASLFEELIPGKIYNLTIRDTAACELTEAFVMPFAKKRTIDLVDKLIMELGEERRLKPHLLIPPSLIKDVQWQPPLGLSCDDCLAPILTATSTEVYNLQITDWYGCVSEASTEVQVNRQPEVYFPNAFSPNGDDVNDFFTVFGNESQIIQVEELQIFDRWGNQVFFVENLPLNTAAQGWDGTFEGRPAKPGVYVYRAQIQVVDGRMEAVNGDVLLMR